MTKRLTIVGLGACKGQLSEEGARALSGSKAFFQTARHPAYIQGAATMDDLFEAAEDFDALHSAIAQRLLDAGEDAVYAVPGSARGNRCLQVIAELAQARGVEMRVIAGVGYAQAACAAARRWDERICVAYALDVPHMHWDTSALLCVEEMDTPLRAGEVKLALMEIYPPTWPVQLCCVQDGNYACETLPLCEVDRRGSFDHTCVLLVPPVAFEQMERRGFEQMLELMARLRGPGGCPWDREQTHESLKPCLLEETYEVLDAIDAQDDGMLLEELGDVLLQVVFHARIAQEQGRFGIRDVTSAVCEKLVYRHPHIFAGVVADTPRQVLKNWEQLKKQEKKFTTQAEVLEAIPRNLPALVRSAKVQHKAGQVGFDWNDPGPALDKVLEEAREVRAELERQPRDEEKLISEIGDLLFACVNVSRLSGVHAEFALAQTATRFTRRFAAMEALAASRGHVFSELSLAQMDALWEEVKRNG